MDEVGDVEPLKGWDGHVGGDCLGYGGKGGEEEEEEEEDEHGDDGRRWRAQGAQRERARAKSVWDDDDATSLDDSLI